MPADSIFCGRTPRLYSTLLNWILIFSNLLVCLFCATQKSDTVQEYCENEVFSPQCKSDEVIVMKNAMFGVMSLGRCIKVDYGHLGCGTDVLKSLDVKCSGKSQCDVPIISADFPSCVEEFRNYLQATYQCHTVHVPAKSRCYSQEIVSAGTHQSSLASVTSLSTSCGLHESPWLIEAQSGQTLHIAITDFNWDEKRTGCENYGYIFDMESDDVINICGSSQREHQLYNSKSHQIQVVLNEHAVKQYKFLIHYEASGCPALKQPEHSWMEQKGDKLTFRCIYGLQNWTATCINNVWIGYIGACPFPTTQEMKTVLVTTVQTVEITGWQALPFVSRNHVIAFAIGCTTLIFCCAIIVLGVYCSKRYQAKINNSRGMALEKAIFPVGTLRNLSGATIDQETLVFRPVATTSSLHSMGNDSTLPIDYLKQDSTNRNNMYKSLQTNHTHNDTQYHNTKDVHESLHFHQEHGYDIGQDIHKYYVLENPREVNTAADSGREQLYQSIHQLQNGDLLS